MSMTSSENYNSKKRRSLEKARAASHCPASQDRIDTPSMVYILFLFASLSPPPLPGPLIWSSREATPMTRPPLIPWGSLVLSHLPQASIYSSFSQSLCLLCCLGMLVPETRLCKPLANALPLSFNPSSSSSHSRCPHFSTESALSPPSRDQGATKPQEAEAVLFMYPVFFLHLSNPSLIPKSLSTE